MTLEDDINRRLAEPLTYDLPRESARRVVQALRLLPETCRYHGGNFERLGIEPWGEPRCDSCKAPWHRERALEVLTGRSGDDADLER